MYPAPPSILSVLFAVFCGLGFALGSAVQSPAQRKQPAEEHAREGAARAPADARGSPSAPDSTEAAAEGSPTTGPDARSVPQRPSPGDAELRGIYLSFWSTTLPDRVAGLVELAREGAVNAVVIDLKDAQGRVGFDTRVDDAVAYRARIRIIRDLRALVRRLQEAGLYVIARIVVFTDPALARARPEWAVHSKAALARDGARLSESTLWVDSRKLAWADPGARQVWDYNIAIAGDALSAGVDELNFDYIRFPSEGDLSDMHFPVSGERLTRREVIRSFFAYLRGELPDVRLSADLFGLVTVTRDDLGIGQVIEDAFAYFDYVCPMVYPSHFADGFRGFANPAEHPYEVVRFALSVARERWLAHAGGLPGRSRLRPWLQDFNIGAEYDSAMVMRQIQAARDALGDLYSGFLLWSPSNRYSTEALRQR